MQCRPILYIRYENGKYLANYFAIDKCIHIQHTHIRTYKEFERPKERKISREPNTVWRMQSLLAAKILPCYDVYIVRRIPFLLCE